MATTLAAAIAARFTGTEGALVREQERARRAVLRSDGRAGYWFYGHERKLRDLTGYPVRTHGRALPMPADITTRAYVAHWCKMNYLTHEEI